MTTLKRDLAAFGERLTEHGQRLNQANALLVRRESAASLRKYPAAPAPAPTAEEREERFRAECEKRGVAYVPLPEGGDDR